MVSNDAGLRQAGTIWMVDLDEPLPAVTPLVPATFRVAQLEDAFALAEIMASSFPAEVSRRFESGRRCYAAWVEGQLAACGWASFEEEYIGEMDLRIRLLPGEAYLWDCITMPSFRRKRLFTTLLIFMLQELRDGPICRVWIGANQENVASQRGIARAGFHSVADLEIAGSRTARVVRLRGRPAVPERLVGQARRAFLGELENLL